VALADCWLPTAANGTIVADRHYLRLLLSLAKQEGDPFKLLKHSMAWIYSPGTIALKHKDQQQLLLLQLLLTLLLPLLLPPSLQVPL